MQKKTIIRILIAVLVVLVVSATWIFASVRVAKDYMWEKHAVIKPQAVIGGRPEEAKAKMVYIPTPDDIELEMYYDSLETLAMLTESEAGNQGYKGKRLVSRVVLNRVISKLFPNDIRSVIYAPHQFEVVSNGRINCIPSEETYKAVQDELANSSDDRILFFTAGQYNPSGTPLYSYKNHYFSGR